MGSLQVPAGELNCADALEGFWETALDIVSERHGSCDNFALWGAEEDAFRKPLKYADLVAFGARLAGFAHEVAPFESLFESLKFTGARRGRYAARRFGRAQRPVGGRGLRDAIKALRAGPAQRGPEPRRIWL